MTITVGSLRGSSQGMNRPAFTCSSCHCVFNDAESQKAHYQSDWHRYNLRRKVQEMPPVTQEAYLARIDAAQKNNRDVKGDPRVESSSGAAPTYDCKCCKKTFASLNSYENHLKSKKHMEQASKPQANQIPDTTKQLEEEHGRDQSTPLHQAANQLYLDPNCSEEQILEAIKSKLAIARRLRAEECIFCNSSSLSFEENMEHMVKEHSLYIPDLEFVEDLPGLIQYLGDKVSVAHCCLYCPSSVQPFSGLEAVRRHMVDKGHSKIRFDPEDGMEELAEFYNYEQIVSDDDDENFVDVDRDEEEYYLEQEGSLIISPDETELILPSGKRLGHRAYRVYYKQNIRIEPTPERQSRRGEHQALVARMSDHYMAMGLAQPAEQRRHLIDQRRDMERRKDWDNRMGVRNNKILQEYFRYQLRQ